MRTGSASNGGTRTVPPCFSARDAAASASSVANVTLQCAGPSSVSGWINVTASMKPPGAPSASTLPCRSGLFCVRNVAVAGQLEDREVGIAHRKGFRFPSEHRAVEGGGGPSVARVQLAEVPRAGLVDELCADRSSGLPDRERRAFGIGERGKAARVHRVDRFGEHRSTGCLHLLGRFVRAGDGGVGVPRDRGIGCDRAADRGDVEVMQLRDPVLAPGVIGHAVLALPPEQLAVERGRGLGIGLHRLDPARDAGGVGSPFEHGAPPVSLPFTFLGTIRRKPRHRLSALFGGDASSGCWGRSLVRHRRVSRHDHWRAKCRTGSSRR